MGSIRQQKVARLIQKELGDIFLTHSKGFLNGAMVSVTVVRMSPDFKLARTYLSIFAPGGDEDLLDVINSKKFEIRHELARRVKNQLRAVPEIAFFEDDSLSYAQEINDLLKDK